MLLPNYLKSFGNVAYYPSFASPETKQFANEIEAKVIFFLSLFRCFLIYFNGSGVYVHDLRTGPIVGSTTTQQQDSSTTSFRTLVLNKYKFESFFSLSNFDHNSTK
jgi:hypothetical protein